MHETIIIIAQYFILIPVLASVYIFFKLPSSRRLNFTAQLLIAGALSYCLALLASKLIHDPRPFVTGHFVPLIPHSSDNGFPSDHTLLASFLAWSVLHYSRKLGLALLAVALLIGLARMAAGVHHSWDILGSFVITAFASFIAVRLLQLKQKHRS